MTPRYRYLVCPTCATRRRVWQVVVRPADYYQRRCSQGHLWYVAMGTLERCNQVVLETLIPAITTLFAQPSPFYEALRGRR